MIRDGSLRKAHVACHHALEKVSEVTKDVIKRSKDAYTKLSGREGAIEGILAVKFVEIEWDPAEKKSVSTALFISYKDGWQLWCPEQSTTLHMAAMGCEQGIR